MKKIEVLIEYNILGMNHPFTYLCEDDVLIEPHTRVYVPFNNQKVVGYVINVIDTNYTFDELCKIDNVVYKKVLEVLDKEPILNEELIDLAAYMSHEYVAPLISCYQTMLPPYYKPAKSSFKQSEGRKIYKVLINKEIENIKLTKRQKEIYDLINDKHEIDLKDLPTGIINKLIELGLVSKKQVVVDNDYFKEYLPDNKNVLLNQHQQKVYDEFINTKDTTYLLQGVTGSGKTEIYLKLAAHYQSLDKSVIIMVPEISLTPNIIRKFKARFENIAILHGSLSNSEKLHQYELIKSGKAKVIIGARSAIFAPCKNLGLIILDEEQSNAYKQDKTPCYHARDIAIYRAKRNNAKVLLGSATPSLESMARASKGTYHHLRIDVRANNQPLPEVKIVSLRDDISTFSPLFSNTLDRAIKETLAKKEKVILFYNRRGYSPYVSCRNCGYIFKCKNCELSLSYHKAIDSFKCHYCNNEIHFDHKCPKCGSDDFLFMGSGTQKIEEVITSNYPEAKLLRMDIDSTSNKNGHLHILDKFENDDYNILLGTQMVSKGLDFNDVTLVGVINADMSLAIADFRSNETTFDLLDQVAGRAGRGNKIGKVIIQTYQEDNKVINLASRHDFDGFYLSEMKFRHSLNYPPFSYLSTITISSIKKEQVVILADHIFFYLKENSDFELIGPAFPYVYKDQDSIKMRMIIKSKNHQEMVVGLNQVYNEFEREAKERKCNLLIDIDSYKLL